jgi:hypothetical protein
MCTLRAAELEKPGSLNWGDGPLAVRSSPLARLWLFLPRREQADAKSLTLAAFPSAKLCIFKRPYITETAGTVARLRRLKHDSEGVARSEQTSTLHAREPRSANFKFIGPSFQAICYCINYEWAVSNTTCHNVCICAIRTIRSC